MSMPDNAESVTNLTASCHCRTNQYAFFVPNSSLPLSAYLCHCNISRRISGVLFTSYVSVPSTNPPPNRSTLSPYKSSSILTRHFCTTCSTHMFLEYAADGHWEVATGTLDRSDDEIIDFKGHMWIEDTIDGGGSIWLPSLGTNKEKPAERWLVAPHSSPEIPLDWAATNPPAKADDKLHAHCHCNGVQFYITRPTPTPTPGAHTPSYPDLLTPYHSSHPHSVINPSGQPWWLRQSSKYLAGNCACSSCRQISGFDIQQWAFVPKSSIFLPDGEPFPLQERLWGSMREYRSSEGIVRMFCGVCGAECFWDGEERGGDLVDVAVGLLDAESGARAEGWLEWWWGRVSFEELGINRGLVESLEKGLRRWGEQSGG